MEKIKLQSFILRPKKPEGVFVSPDMLLDLQQHIEDGEFYKNALDTKKDIRVHGGSGLINIGIERTRTNEVLFLTVTRENNSMGEKGKVIGLDTGLPKYEYDGKTDQYHGNTHFVIALDTPTKDGIITGRIYSHQIGTTHNFRYAEKILKSWCLKDYHYTHQKSIDKVQLKDFNDSMPEITVTGSLEPKNPNARSLEQEKSSKSYKYSMRIEDTSGAGINLMRKIFGETIGKNNEFLPKSFEVESVKGNQAGLKYSLEDPRNPDWIIVALTPDVYVERTSTIDSKTFISKCLEHEETLAGL